MKMQLVAAVTLPLRILGPSHAQPHGAATLAAMINAPAVHGCPTAPRRQPRQASSHFLTKLNNLKDLSESSGKRELHESPSVACARKSFRGRNWKREREREGAAEPLHQSHSPFFGPSLHLSSTNLHSNIGFPNLSFTSLCIRHIH